MLERIKNEPVLITTFIIAIGNLVGSDLAPFAEWVGSGIVIVLGFVARAKVTPMRKIVADNHDA
jgi:hypothetical protein